MKVLSGFNKITFIGINLIPETGDTLLQIDTLVLEPSVKGLFTGHFTLHSFAASDLALNLVKNDTTSNYNVFLRNSNNKGYEYKNKRVFKACQQTTCENLLLYARSNRCKAGTINLINQWQKRLCNFFFSKN